MDKYLQKPQAGGIPMTGWNMFHALSSWPSILYMKARFDILVLESDCNNFQAHSIPGLSVQQADKLNKSKVFGQTIIQSIGKMAAAFVHFVVAMQLLEASLNGQDPERIAATG